MPPDTEVTPVSRTIGADQLVDEMIFKFTHTVRMDWMLPGIPPTGKRVEVPLVAIVRFRGDKLAHEHIYWDQASVLVQLGLLDPATMPVAGIETARKVLDNALPSNALMQRAGPVDLILPLSFLLETRSFPNSLAVTLPARLSGSALRSSLPPVAPFCLS